MGAQGRHAQWDPINVEVFFLSVMRHSFMLIDRRRLIAFLLASHSSKTGIRPFRCKSMPFEEKINQGVLWVWEPGNTGCPPKCVPTLNGYKVGVY